MAVGRRVLQALHVGVSRRRPACGAQAPRRGKSGGVDLSSGKRAGGCGGRGRHEAHSWRGWLGAASFDSTQGPINVIAEGEREVREGGGGSFRFSYWRRSSSAGTAEARYAARQHR